MHPPHSDKFIGGKARGLELLRSNGLPTPNFYILDHLTLKKVVQGEITVIETLAEFGLTEDKIRSCLWAVRSSAEGEDSSEKSFAGQFKTLLNVTASSLQEAVSEVMQSYQRSSSYSEQLVKFGVIVQEMLDPDISGVFFTRDPLKPYSDQPVINIITGLGDKLVSGELSGLHIEFEKYHPNSSLASDIIVGEKYSAGQLVKVEKTSFELNDLIFPFIPTMIREGLKLEERLGEALDFEFAIKDNHFYWLQIRPITTRKIHEKFAVWDNTSVEANFPEITLPLSASFTAKTFYLAYGNGFKLLKFNTNVSKCAMADVAHMAGNIEGHLFYNVTAWQNLIYQLPFGQKLSRKLPDIWGMRETPFTPPKVVHSKVKKGFILLKLMSLFVFRSKKMRRDYLSLHEEYISKFDKGSLKEKSFIELIQLYVHIERSLGENWFAPVFNGLYAMIFQTALKRSIRNSKLIKKNPNYLNDVLMSDGEVISVQLVQQFQAILNDIIDRIELKQAFERSNNDEILETLRSDFPQFFQRINEYIERFGNRTNEGELKMETVSYQDDPLLFIEYIKSNIVHRKPTKTTQNRFNTSNALKETYPRNFVRRAWIGYLTKNYVARIKARENYRFMRTDTFAVIRSIFNEMGVKLADQAIIDHSRDLLYLELDELLNGNQKNFKQLIEARKTEYQSFNKNIGTNRFIECQGQFFAESEGEIELIDGEIKGIGCCSGNIEGIVHLIDSNADLSVDYSDKILIAGYFEPGWIHLFESAKGIISERGNLLSHTAIICRELNVPSIVGAKGILNFVKNGDRIKMDGARGVIKLNEGESL